MLIIIVVISPFWDEDFTFWANRFTNTSSIMKAFKMNHMATQRHKKLLVVDKVTMIGPAIAMKLLWMNIWLPWGTISEKYFVQISTSVFILFLFFFLLKDFLLFFYLVKILFGFFGIFFFLYDSFGSIVNSVDFL